MFRRVLNNSHLKSKRVRQNVEKTFKKFGGTLVFKVPGGAENVPHL
jgi:hypothetical protein